MLTVSTAIKCVEHVFWCVWAFECFLIVWKQRCSWIAMKSEKRGKQLKMRKAFEVDYWNWEIVADEWDHRTWLHGYNVQHNFFVISKAFFSACADDETIIEGIFGGFSRDSVCAAIESIIYANLYKYLMFACLILVLWKLQFFTHKDI